MVVLRLLLLPFKLLLAVLGVTFRTGVRAGRAPVRLSWRLAKLGGPMGWFCFFFGLAVGLLLAPVPGRQLRAKLQAALTQLASGSGGGEDLATKVAFELAHAPRTWHLPQPTVTVAAGQVRLSGQVGSEDERAELGRVAAAIPGVHGVTNDLSIPDGDEPAAP